MAHIHNISLENYKLFKERTDLSFAPITVLTGTNSSGKSSMMQACKLIHRLGKKQLERGQEDKSVRSLASNLTFEDLLAPLNMEIIEEKQGDFSKLVSKGNEDQPVRFRFEYRTEAFGEVEVEFSYTLSGMLRVGQISSLVVRPKGSEAYFINIAPINNKYPKDHINFWSTNGNGLLQVNWRQIRETFMEQYELDCKMIGLYNEMHSWLQEKKFATRQELIAHLDDPEHAKYLDKLTDKIYNGHPSRKNIYLDEEKVILLDNSNELIHVGWSHPDYKHEGDNFIGLHFPVQIPKCYTYFDFHKEISKNEKLVESFQNTMGVHIKDYPYEKLNEWFDNLIFIEGCPENMGLSLFPESGQVMDLNRYFANPYSYHTLFLFRRDGWFDKKKTSFFKGEEIRFPDTNSTEEDKLIYFLSENFIEDHFDYQNDVPYREFNKVMLTEIGKTFFYHVQKELHRKPIEQILNFVKARFLSSGRSMNKRLQTFKDGSDLGETAYTFLDKGTFGNASAVGFINKHLRIFHIGEEIIVDKLDEGNQFGLYLKKDNEKILLADEGQGISQLLPILMTIANMSIGPTDYQDNHKPQTLFIEEPEANLHPALQSKLADMFYEAYQKFNIQFIIETHSEYLIRRLQVLTADPKSEMRPRDTQIYYFYHPSQIPEGEPQVYPINIQEDGALTKNFGRGFFDESSNLNIALYGFTKAQNN